MPARIDVQAPFIGPGAGLARCAVQPPYVRLNLDVQQSWVNAESGSLAALPEGWESLGDAAIDGRVSDAMVGNPALGETLARVDQAAAQLYRSKAEPPPQLDLNASVSREQTGSTGTEDGGLACVAALERGLKRRHREREPGRDLPSRVAT